MKNSFYCALLLVATLALSSCKKEAGEGGNSSITGYIHLSVINLFDNSDTLSTHDGFDEDVFIIYGDDISYGDRIRSGPDGKFEFKYLRKGTYRLYVYSESNNVLGAYNPDTTIIKSIEITEKKQTKNAGTFEIRKYK